MPFLRSGHDGTFDLPIEFPKLRVSRSLFGLVTLFSLSAATASHAAAKKPVGVQAWTSGSQTFIRARPGATVPPVAKVSRHTPIYVWGKYNGWYRVETHDHIFGWVFNQYLNAPELAKVREMPRAKARLASDRTDNQMMYGTPDVLKKHYTTYGAAGALKGLQKQGLFLTVAPKAIKPKTLVAKVASKPVPNNSKSAPRLAALNHSAKTAPRIDKPASPVPVGEDGTSSDAVPNTQVAEAPRQIETGKISDASRGMMPSTRMFARAVTEAASQPSETTPEQPESAPVAVAPKVPVVTAPPAPHPVVKPVFEVVAPKPKPKAAVKVAAKVKSKTKVAKVTKATYKSRYAAWKEVRREQLRTRMGLAPAPVAPSMVAPVSPAELLKARQAFLEARKARLNGQPAPVVAPVTTNSEPLSSVGNIAPLPEQNSALGGPLSPAPPAHVQPSAFSSAAHKESNEADHPLQIILSDPQIVALAQMKPKDAAKAAPVTISLSARGGSPRDRAAMPRGGSPRDRFGTGLATQAFSYRGMPYIRGAASPSRGFDCSGLVYFLLRQRGYNPPRTAAGYRNFGTNVPRGQWKPGDLVLFANTYKPGISHIGVYLGNGKFVHAATSGTGVRVSSLSEAYYTNKYWGARRVK